MEDSWPRFAMGVVGSRLTWATGQFLAKAQDEHFFSQPAPRKVLDEFLDKCGNNTNPHDDRVMSYALKLAEVLPGK